MEERMQGHWIRTIDDWNLSRRELLAALGAGLGSAVWLGGSVAAQDSGATPAATPAGRVKSLTIDLSSEPNTLDPALTYDANGWSLVHSIYDSLLQYDNDGNLELLLADRWEWTSPTTIAVGLRPNVSFHNGEPLTARRCSSRWDIPPPKRRPRKSRRISRWSNRSTRSTI